MDFLSVHRTSRIKDWLLINVTLDLLSHLGGQQKKFLVWPMADGKRNRPVWVSSIMYFLNTRIIFYNVRFIHSSIDIPASQCAPLPEAPHSNITILNGGGRSYGTIVRFECEPGFVRSGHPVILCMSNGTWSDEVPTCSRK